jgi:hypothetical protein
VQSQQRHNQPSSDAELFSKVNRYVCNLAPMPAAGGWIVDNFTVIVE